MEDIRTQTGRLVAKFDSDKQRIVILNHKEVVVLEVTAGKDNKVIIKTI